MRYAAGIPGLLQRLDNTVKGKAVKDARGFEQQGVDRHMEGMRQAAGRDDESRKAGVQGPSEVDVYMRNNMDDQYAAAKVIYDHRGEAARPDIAARMNRGLMGMGQRGPLEALARATATNRGLRQGGLTALGAGTAVASGAALTEGAQQLLALMEYMQGQQNTEERVATSELAQPMGMV